MNEINSFTFFKNYYEVIKELPKEDKRDILESIVDYVFEDKTPNLTGLKKGIWQLIQRPIDISKRNGSNKSKKNGEQMENKSKKNGEQMEKECSDLSISISNSCSNILENKGCGEKKPFKEIIDYLNQKANTHFKYNSKTTQSKINARLNEGYVLDDFIAVIDKKFNEWNNTEFEQYLCPETLFGPKFEKYLNQKPLKQKTNNKPNWIEKDILEDKASDEEIKALEERLKRR